MSAVRYNLDSLGWFQFEWLIQALLKAELGPGVQSWGGRGDWGRDAFSDGPLKFPARDIETEGPFIFQAKFISGANAAGAKFGKLLLDACKKELQRISDRISNKAWSRPNYYILLTNAPVSSAQRKQIEAQCRKVIKSKVAVLGGHDISDLLDKNSIIARTFPQILSLRNLYDLLEEVVNRETIQRSNAALKAAEDIIGVFVPTAAYNRTWQILSKHHFAVLEGPPEMGKTAIAWMIAIAQLANNWEAITCDDPSDFFRSHKHDRQQVFVADDAFGRTEYDPTLGSKWEKQLQRVMSLLDQTHWLIWTSRRHILERARREMDLQGTASSFPDPGAILVKAAQLGDQEKALILYRHARAANLEQAAKKILKNHIKTIVKDPSFTPERIRRFVHESLPQLMSAAKAGTLKLHMIGDEIHNALHNPTERMVKSFRALPSEHKLLLVALLEEGHAPTVNGLKTKFQQYTDGNASLSFNQLLEELSEAFVKT